MRFELSDMIVGLREEIQKAQKNALKEELKFTIDSIEIEAQCSVSTEADANGGVKWKFFIFTEAELKAGIKVSRDSVQTIKLKLTPKGLDGHVPEVAGETTKPKRS